MGGEDHPGKRLPEGEPPMQVELDLDLVNLQTTQQPAQDENHSSVAIDAVADGGTDSPLPGTPPRTFNAQTPVPVRPQVPVGPDDTDDELALCIVCYERPSGTALDPCGHDHFCEHCATQFRTCPLCREPLVPRGALPGTEARPSLLSPTEACQVVWLGVLVYGIIFVGGYIENCYNVPGAEGQSSPDDRCIECFSTGWERGNGGRGGRANCQNESLLQAGSGCYAQLEDIPAVQTGAALGGTTYFVLIVLTQALGMACEVVLIRRLLRRNLLRKQ